MSSYVIDWLSAFAFTQLIEVPLYSYLLGCSGLRAFGASALTHPVIWCVFPYLHLGYAWAVALAEVFAWLAETAYFARPYGVRRALATALLANGASAVLGSLSRWLFGVP